MFGLDKKQKQKKPEVKEEVIEVDIHTMPAKYLPGGLAPTKGVSGASANPHKLVGLLIIIGAVAVIIGGAAYYLLVIAKKTNQLPVNVNQLAVMNKNENINKNVNFNTNISNKNINQNENQNRNLNQNANIKANINAGVNLNFNINSNWPRNINANVNSPVIVPILPTSLDTDKDLLTDKEEDLYLTKYVMPDSDSDGYLDGKEVMAGYDPNQGGGAKLADAESMTDYQDQKYFYEILYPKTWLIDVDAQTDKVLFSAALGEFIEILVEKNSSRLSPREWYIKQSPGIDFSELQLVTAGEIKGIKSPDGLNVYLFVGDNVFVITYNIGTLQELNYKATFEMMVNSFKLTKSIPEEPLPSATPAENVNNQPVVEPVEFPPEGVLP